MRKLLIVTLLASVALGGVAACASGTPTDSSSSPTGSSAADQTATVCQQALALEKSKSSEVLAKVQAALASMAAGGSPDLTGIQADLEKIQSDWVTAFQGFASQPVKPEVKTAINNFITYLQAIGQSSNTDSIPQVTAKFAELDQALTAACA